MKSRAFIITILLITFVSACKKEKDDDSGKDTSNLVLTTSESDYQSALNIPSDVISDPFDLREITVNGREVEITVSYAGGCAPHTFEVIWDGTLIKTNPPQINLAIIHNANGDMCEAYITEILKFNLDSLVGDIKPGEIHIDGHSGYDGTDSADYAGNAYEFDFTESMECSIRVTAQEAMCGWGLWENTWFALEDSVYSGFENYYYPCYLQPVSIADGLEEFVPVSGKTYRIGAVVDSTVHEFGEIPICLAWPGPSIPVKITCVEEL